MYIMGYIGKSPGRVISSPSQVSCLISGNTEHLVLTSIICCDTAELKCHHIFAACFRNVSRCGEG